MDDDVWFPAVNPIDDAGLTVMADGLQSNSNLTYVDTSGASAWLIVSLDAQ